MIARAVVVLLALAALAYVLGALRRSPSRGPGPRSEHVAELEARKASALGAIVDLENELGLGKLTEPDFRELTDAYEAEALEALRQLDALGDGSNRPALPAADTDALEDEIAAARARLECPSCGAPRRAGTACPRCGA